MDTLKFAENPVQVLSLEQLERSYHEDLPTGQPVGGIYHYALIQEVLEAFEKRRLNPVVREVFAASNRDSRRPGVTILPQLEERYGEKAIEAHLLRRVYANIEIRADETDELVTCLAVAYHQKGIQFGIGPMVKVCHNQTILGAQDVASNYHCYGSFDKSENLSVEGLIERANEWAERYHPHQTARMMDVLDLKNAELTQSDIYELIGRLVEKRIIHDSQDDRIHKAEPYPLNSSQINQACEKLFVMMSTKEEKSYWDAYQELNQVLKPDRMDVPQVLPQSLALFELLKEMIS